MISTDQLLESVDLDFEPRWVTKDKNGEICIWDYFKPYPDEEIWNNTVQSNDMYFGKLKLAEFDGKDWTECIYEVPRKTTGNEIEQKMLAELEQKLNAIVDAAIKAVNELKGAKNE